VSASEASTSNSASTRVSVFWACWPPGPLEREKRSWISRRGSATERVTRIDSPSMATLRVRLRRGDRVPIPTLFPHQLPHSR
jgi:hypothetical protein